MANSAWWPVCSHPSTGIVRRAWRHRLVTIPSPTGGDSGGEVCRSGRLCPPRSCSTAVPGRRRPPRRGPPSVQPARRPGRRREDARTSVHRYRGAGWWAPWPQARSADRCARQAVQQADTVSAPDPRGLRGRLARDDARPGLDPAAFWAPGPHEPAPGGHRPGDPRPAGGPSTPADHHSGRHQQPSRRPRISPRIVRRAISTYQARYAASSSADRSLLTPERP